MTDSLPPDMTEIEQSEKESSADEMKKQIQIRLGQQLRTARKRREMTIPEASSRLRIREVYLKGLENGDWSNLPEEVYVLGFLRQYAALLGEDLHEDIEMLKSGGYQLTKPFTMPDPPIAPNKMWAMAAGILFVLLFILFNVVGDGEKEVPSPEVSAVNITPPPAEEAATKQIPSKEVAKRDITPVAQPPDALSSSGKASTGTNIKTLSQMDKKTVPSSPTGFPEKVFKTHRYRLTAIEASAWLQVHDPSGTLLKEALLHPGQSLRLESSAPFLSVTCGNAAALQIEVDGTLYATAGTLGAPEKVLHDFRIEPDHDN
jgi:cytoskeleton protein RodZ